MINDMKIRANISLPITYFKEGKSFVAYTPALDLSSSGDTLKQAEKHIKEAVELFVQETVSLGTLDEVLSNLGWEKVRKQWIPPIFVSQDILSIKV